MKTVSYYDMELSDIVFQHDNASVHTAKIIKDWIDEKEMSVHDWPPHSSDLNPIEHVWREVKKRLDDLPRKPTSINTLWDKVQEVWENIDPDFCKRVVDWMPQCIEDVIKSKGGHTRW